MPWIMLCFHLAGRLLIGCIPWMRRYLYCIKILWDHHRVASVSLIFSKCSITIYVQEKEAVLAYCSQNLPIYTTVQWFPSFIHLFLWLTPTACIMIYTTQLLGEGGIRNRICLAIHRNCTLIPNASAVVRNYEFNPTGITSIGGSELEIWIRQDGYVSSVGRFWMLH
jgi:hypothetical protein